MRILVINGSPKGAYSITLQTVLYLEKRYPEHTFRILHAGKEIRKLEKDFSGAERELKEAELLLFSYPVYTFSVPSQLHRFVELLKTSGMDLSGKYATQVSTSKHFYDVTAHEFIRENCRDLSLRYIPGLSADMDDLLTERGQKEAEAFFEALNWKISQGIFERLPEDRRPVGERKPVTVPETDGTEKPGDVVIVADLPPEDKQLARMIGRFQSRLSLASRVVNIREFPFGGGCISCFRCAADGTCFYPDRFDTFLRENIQTAQAIVIAFSIRDHSMGSVFKTYDDRQFCNGHRTVTEGVPFAYLVSGDLEREPNLKMIIQARAEVGGNYLAGIATDETDPDGEIDRTAECLAYAVKNGIRQPKNFYGVGGMKIFRDLIWTMQGLMREDHRFFKKSGQYDFPQKKFGRMLKMYPVGMLMSNRKLLAKMGNRMNEGMIAPYRKVIEQTDSRETDR